MLLLLAQAADSAPGSSPYSMFILVGIFFAIFYFMIMRPQAKQQRQHKDFLARLAKGDEVVTAGGVVGRIDRVQGELVFVEVANNVKLRVLKSQITSSFTASAAPEEKGDKAIAEADRK